MQAHGLADRAHGVPFTADTRVGVASGAKGFTALTVMRLVEDGVLTLGTRARELLRDDLPLIDDARHDRAPAGAPIGDRRLPRRVPGARPRRPPACRCRCTSSTPPSPTSRCSAASHRPSRPTPTSPTATAASSCSRSSPSGPRGRPVPRPGPPPRHRPRRSHADGVPPLRRAARRRGARLPAPRRARRRAAHQRPAPAGRRRRRRRHLHHRRRRDDALAGPGRRQGPGPGDLGRRCGGSAAPRGSARYGLGFWLEGDAVYLTGSDTGASFISQHLPGRLHLVGARQHHRRGLAGGAAPRRAAAGVRFLVLLTRGSVLDVACPGGA